MSLLAKNLLARRFWYLPCVKVGEIVRRTLNGGWTILFHNTALYHADLSFCVSIRDAIHFYMYLCCLGSN